MAKDQKDLAEFFEVEELESRLEMCWAACVDSCCCCDINKECGTSVGDAACIPPVNASCGGGGGGE